VSERRDSNGQFCAGHPGGPGRPPRQTEAAYLLALSEAVTPDRWRAIVARAIEDAEQGDDKARAWLSTHLLPKAGSGTLWRTADAEARQDRFDRGEQTTDDIIWSFSGR
jgi:hypothetical protein